MIAGWTFAGLARLLLLLASSATLVQAATGLDRPNALPPEPLAAMPTAPTLDPIEAAATAEKSRTMLGQVEVVRELAVPRWLEPGEYVWDAEGAPAGETVIVVNIRARVLSVYRAGVEIGRSSLIYGADNKPTPHGVFPILQKNADHVSNLYNAPMPHMLRLTWDGVAIHGSAELRDDLGTRGCVGLPEEFADLLFDQVKLGDRVIVWDGTNPASVPIA